MEAFKKHSDIVLALAERQPIDIAEFEEAENLYNEMTLNEKSYRTQNKC